MINCVKITWKLIRGSIKTCLFQHFEADFLWKVSLITLNSGLILKTFTHGNTFGLSKITDKKTASKYCTFYHSMTSYGNKKIILNQFPLSKFSLCPRDDRAEFGLPALTDGSACVILSLTSSNKESVNPT